MTWDFFRQFNSFADLSIGNFDTNAFCLYMRLLMINNKAGRIEWFGVTNERLMIETGLNEKSIIKARNDLIQKGFILYSKGKKGSPSKYCIVPLDENFLIHCNKFTAFYTPENLQGIFYSKYDSEYGSVSDRENGSKNDRESCRHNRVEKSTLEESRVDGDAHAEIFHEKTENEIDDVARRVVNYFQNQARLLNTLEVKHLSSLTRKFSADLLIKAIDSAVETCRKNGDKIQSLNYIEAICEKLAKRGGAPNGNDHNNDENGTADKSSDEYNAEVSSFFSRPIHTRRKRCPVEGE